MVLLIKTQGNELSSVFYVSSVVRAWEIIMEEIRSIAEDEKMTSEEIDESTTFYPDGASLEWREETHWNVVDVEDIDYIK